MSYRPAIFERMGPAFARGFGNVDAVFTVNGVERPSVRGIFRQWRDVGLLEAEDITVEGTQHQLSVPSGDIAGVVSQRDTVALYPLDKTGARTGEVISCTIRNHADDGRAMTKLWLMGDV